MNIPANREPINERLFPLQGELNESIIDADILGAVIAIRDSGIETIASNSGVGEIGSERGWGSFIQIALTQTQADNRLAERVLKFADDISQHIRVELGNREIALQLVSAERWHEDRNTTSLDSRFPIYRLQLVGPSHDDEIRYAWTKVAKSFDLPELTVS